MTNWLESEEEKKALKEKKRLLEINEASIRAEDLSKKAATIDINLKTFYDLCNRVLKLNINSLNISRLKVVGSKFISHKSKEYFTDEGVTYCTRERTVTGKRSVGFSATDSDQILIDILGYSVITIHDDEDQKGYETTDSATDKFSKKCLLQDLLAWPEDKMIKIIRWLIFELDSFEENLPGDFENLIEKKKQAEIHRQQNLQLELERKAKEIDDANLTKSIGKGILWALIGIPIGFIAGGIIGFVLSMIYILVANKNAHEGDQFMNSTMYIVIVICVIIGFFVGFTSTREKK